MKLILGSDHAGYRLKEYLKKYLDKRKIAYVDVGTYSEEPVDYPVYAAKVAKKVASGKNMKGILVCGNAEGVCIAANKVKGARAAVCYDAYTAKTSRQDDNANIICLRGRKFSYLKEKNVLKAWLETPFSKKKRHVRRLKEVKQLERNG